MTPAPGRGGDQVRDVRAHVAVPAVPPGAATGHGVGGVDADVLDGGDGHRRIVGAVMVEAGRRRRSLPAPPHVVAESLREPDRDPARPWLHLLPDERRPQVVETGDRLVVWSSPWPAQPEALVRFELADGAGGGTDLT